MTLTSEGEGCLYARGCIHLLTCFSKYFLSSHVSSGSHREKLTYPALPNSGAPTF